MKKNVIVLLWPLDRRKVAQYDWLAFDSRLPSPSKSPIEYLFSTKTIHLDQSRALFTITHGCLSDSGESFHHFMHKYCILDYHNRENGINMVYLGLSLRYTSPFLIKDK